MGVSPVHFFRQKKHGRDAHATPKVLYREK